MQTVHNLRGPVGKFVEVCARFLTTHFTIFSSDDNEEMRSRAYILSLALADVERAIKRALEAEEQRRVERREKMKNRWCGWSISNLLRTCLGC